MGNLPVVPLADWFETSPDLIGQKALYLAKLHQAEFPIPKAYCIPIPVLEKISKKNNLKKTLTTLLENLNWHSEHAVKAASNLIIKKILFQEVPDQLASELLKAHHQLMKNSYVAVRSSEINPQDPGHHHAILHLQGETTTLQAALKVWAQQYLPEHLEFRARQLQRGQLIPTAIIVQEMIESDVSGIAFTKHPDRNDKHVVSICSTWGVSDHLTGEELDIDRYEYDIRTQQITSRQIGHKTSEHIRELHGTKNQELPTELRLQSSLSDHQLKKLSETIIKLKRHHLEHLKVEWTFHHDRLYLLGIQALAPENNSKKTPFDWIDQQTQTKILVSAGDPRRAKEFLKNNCDGIGLYKSDFTWLKMGIHPQHLLKDNKRTFIKRYLHQSLQAYLEEIKPDETFVYRPLNLLSNELSQLTHGYLYEQPETNPSLGYRGGLRLAQNQLFDLELEVLDEALDLHSKQVTILLPFIRSLSEIKLLSNQIHQYNTQKLLIGVEIAVPGLLYQLATSAIDHISLLQLNIASLQALSFGYDPETDDISVHVAKNQQLIFDFMDKLSTIKTNLFPQANLSIQLDDISYNLVEKAIELGYDSLVVKPHQFSHLKKLVVEYEQKTV